MLAAALLFTCSVVSVYDGDGPIHCREQIDGKPVKIRLSGIAAREMNGRCNANQPCPQASAMAAKRALERLVLGKVLQCRKLGMSYGRTVATCTVGGISVECAMIRTGTVLRWAQYDTRNRLVKCAPSAKTNRAEQMREHLPGSDLNEHWRFDHGYSDSICIYRPRQLGRMASL